MTPTKRSLDHLRAEGYQADVVEKWIPMAHIRKDLFGWIDIVAVHPQHNGILGVQTTTTANVAARRVKARGNPALILWIKDGGRLEIHGWAKRLGQWQVRVWPILIYDLAKIGTNG